MHHRRFPIASSAALGKNGAAFRKAIAGYAEENGIPWIRFAKGDRKIDVVQPLLEAAERERRPGVVAIGVAQEFQQAWDATRKDAPDDGVPWFSWYHAERRVTRYYAYIFDEEIGLGFIKICAYAPYPVKIWCNGHEAMRRMAAAGLRVAPLANGFASCDDPAALQDLCDQLQAGQLRVFFERWTSVLPLPLSMSRLVAAAAVNMPVIESAALPAKNAPSSAHGDGQSERLRPPAGRGEMGAAVQRRPHHVRRDADALRVEDPDPGRASRALRRSARRCQASTTSTPPGRVTP